jgi:undecaprenol kinase
VWILPVLFINILSGASDSIPKQNYTGKPAAERVPEGRMAKKIKIAAAGIWKALATERTMKVIAACFAAAVALGLILRISRLEWCMVLLCCGGVVSLELLNTAIERAVDLFVCEHSKPAGSAKDIAAGATLAFSAVSAAVGLLIFIPHLIGLFG